MVKIYHFPQTNQIPFKEIVQNCKWKAAGLMYDEIITLDEYREFVKWIHKQRENNIKPSTSEVVNRILELIGGL